MSYCVVFEKHIPRNMLSSYYFRNKRQNLTRGVMLVQFSWIYLKYFLSDDSLIAKLEAFELDIGSLSFLLVYLSLRKQRNKVGSSYRKWSEICQEIPQGLILPPSLFNILINNIFFFEEKSKICNFADDNSTY